MLQWRNYIHLMHSCQITVSGEFVHFVQVTMMKYSLLPLLLVYKAIFVLFLPWQLPPFLCKVQEYDSYKFVTNITALFLMQF